MYISIGIPFYNAEKFLLNAIKSVFAQTHTKWELILIDDGSTDNSLKIAKSINDSRVRVISDGKNKKLASRLNEIVQLAKYDLIARMDADDLMSPTRIEKQIHILKNNPDIDLVTTGLFSVTDDLQPISVRWNNNLTISHKDLLKRNIVVHAAIVARKSWFKRNPYDTKLKVAQDYNSWLRASYNNDFKLQFIPEALYYYREEGNTSIKKMLLAGKYGRKMFYKYGGSSKYFLILRSYIKNLIAITIVTLGMNKFLLKRRGKPITNKKLLNRFQKEIQLIKNTTI